MKNLAGFDFAVSPVNEGLVRELHGGGFLAIQRNAVLIGGADPASYCPSRDLLRIAAVFGADQETPASKPACLGRQPDFLALEAADPDNPRRPFAKLLGRQHAVFGQTA